ncbi:hypothetical protein HMPREF1321_1292 [Capnocytophaga sp. oral taxon 412 str. F0487]|jgi:hypothetical protein|uniref:hypothetical protein n=1 Tax=Capnocytophaga sp. oral taxon 412 TaxID=712218 RepID=UPI0002696743|nr:hypothetical protein [Capnocytophaga sp. oral taxon 412]EIW92887.1 hypothetical protein HMPREF1321_1292 [Capnocytophaga sp. oral taxon 412 str. F0487]
MDLFSYTQQWLKGELLEGKLVLAFAISTALLGVVFWKFGSTPTAKALLIPLLVVGAIYTAVGTTLITSNAKYNTTFTTEYKEDPTAFAEKEKARVEGFQYQYVISKAVATVCFVLTLLIFWFSKSYTWQGIGIGLTYFGLVGLVVDYFSQQRAEAYYERILQFING